MAEILSAEKEVEAQLLAQRISQAAHEELLQMARILVGVDAGALFGATEFKIREILHRVAAKAYEQHLAEKKTATSAPALSAPTATKPPRTTRTGRAAR